MTIAMTLGQIRSRRDHHVGAGPTIRIGGFNAFPERSRIL
jgi:hypothetical protein